MGLSEAATEKLLIIADKISNQKYMSAIKNAFSTLMPVIITGAFLYTCYKCYLFYNNRWNFFG